MLAGYTENLATWNSTALNKVMKLVEWGWDPLLIQKEIQCVARKCKSTYRVCGDKLARVDIAVEFQIKRGIETIIVAVE